QQVLDSDELVLLLPGLDKGHVEGDFQFLRNHLGCLSRPAPVRRGLRRSGPGTTLTLKSPPSCTATGAGACARCRSPDLVSRRRPRGRMSRTPPSPLDAPAASPAWPSRGSSRKQSATPRRQSPSACSRRSATAP